MDKKNKKSEKEEKILSTLLFKKRLGFGLSRSEKASVSKLMMKYRKGKIDIKLSEKEKKTKIADLEIIEEIYEQRDKIISNINRESVDVYIWLKNEYEKGNILDNLVFQFIFRSYYRLDSAGLSGEQKKKYFNLLSNKENNLETILNNFYELPNLKDQNTVQFSFATKLMHTIDNRKPIFDTEVSTVIHKVVSGNNKKAKIESAKIILSYLEDLYSKLYKDKKIQEIIKKFRIKFDVDTEKITDYKIIDFLLWSLGKLKGKKDVNKIDKNLEKRAKELNVSVPVLKIGNALVKNLNKNIKNHMETRAKKLGITVSELKKRMKKWNEEY